MIERLKDTAEELSKRAEYKEERMSEATNSKTFLSYPTTEQKFQKGRREEIMKTVIKEISQN